MTWLFSLLYSAKFFILPSSSMNLIFFWREESSNFVEGLSICVWCFAHKLISMIHFWQQNLIGKASRVPSNGLYPCGPADLSSHTSPVPLPPYCFPLHNSLLHLRVVSLCLEHFPSLPLRCLSVFIFLPSDLSSKVSLSRKHLLRWGYMPVPTLSLQHLCLL